VLDYLTSEQPHPEKLSSVRRLVKFFREEKQIWVTRDICNEALNLAKTRNVPILEPVLVAMETAETAVQDVIEPNPV